MEHPAILLPPIMDIHACATLHTSFLEEIATSETLRLNASAVERIATPAVQLLLSTAQTLQREGKHLQIASPSAALTQAVDDLGLNLLFTLLFKEGSDAGKEIL